MNFVYSSTWPLGSRIRPLLGSSPVRLRTPATPATLHGVDSLDSENTLKHSEWSTQVLNTGLDWWGEGCDGTRGPCSRVTPGCVIEKAGRM